MLCPPNVCKIQGARSLGFNSSKLYFCPSDIHPTFFFSMPISILFSSCVSFVTFSALFIYIRRWGGELQSLYWLLVIICLFLCDVHHLFRIFLIILWLQSGAYAFLLACEDLFVRLLRVLDLYLYSCTWGDVKERTQRGRTPVLVYAGQFLGSFW